MSPTPETTNRMLACMPDPARAAILAQATPSEMAQGRLFAEPGDAPEQVHFVLSGAISLVTVLRDGDCVEAGMVGREGGLSAHGVFSGLGAFTRAICQVAGTVLTLDGDRFRAIAEAHPGVRIAVDRYVEGAANQAQQAIGCRAWHKLEHRFCRWLLTACDHAGQDRIELTQEFMAHMLGVQRQTVSAIASTYKAQGLIRYTRGQISVRDRAGLEACTCECLGAMRTRWDELWGEDAASPVPGNAGEQT